MTPWTTACQASLSFTISQSLLKLKSIESVIPSNHLVLSSPSHPAFFPSIRVSSYESALCIRWPKNWSFNFSISPSNEYSNWFPLGLTSWISLQSKGLSRIFSKPQFESISSLAPSLLLFFFFSFIFISWRLITLQYCSGFCHTLTKIWNASWMWVSSLRRGHANSSLYRSNFSICAAEASMHLAFFMVQLSHPYKTTGKMIALTIWTFVSKVMPLFFIMFHVPPK